MLEGMGHIKTLAFLGTMLSLARIHDEHCEHYDDEPHFDEDPVPGDSFPHHIFETGHRCEGRSNHDINK